MKLLFTACYPTTKIFYTFFTSFIVILCNVVYNIYKGGVLMKISEIIKLLKKNGCHKERSGGSHDIWYSPITKRLFQVPRYGAQEAGTGLTNAILKQAGLK